jgi:hypothetical protein
LERIKDNNKLSVSPLEEELQILKERVYKSEKDI